MLRNTFVCKLSDSESNAEDRIGDLESMVAITDAINRDLRKQVEIREEIIRELHAEIIRLKAEIYDLKNT